MTALPEAPAKPKSWPKRHPVWTTLIVVFGLSGIVNSLDLDESTNPAPAVEAPVFDVPAEDTLVGYGGLTVEEAVAAVTMDSEFYASWCAVNSVDWDLGREVYLDTDPQIGSDEFEGAVFDEMRAGC